MRDRGQGETADATNRSVTQAGERGAAGLRGSHSRSGASRRRCRWPEEGQRTFCHLWLSVQMPWTATFRHIGLCLSDDKISFGQAEECKQVISNSRDLELCRQRAPGLGGMFTCLRSLASQRGCHSRRLSRGKASTPSRSLLSGKCHLQRFEASQASARAWRATRPLRSLTSAPAGCQEATAAPETRT